MNARRVTPVLIVVCLLCAAWTLVSAGEVYGKIVEGSSSVGEAATVEAACGGKSYAPVKTDKSGSYRLVLAETGKCTLTVKYKQQSASLEIASYDDAAQVDLVVALNDGKLSLRRK